MAISRAFSRRSRPQARAVPTIMPGRNFSHSRILQFPRQTLSWVPFCAQPGEAGSTEHLALRRTRCS
ncbi:UNVERIFIED_ORG: hypothetical protein QOE_4398 [Clostridioides difficile F501]